MSTKKILGNPLTVKAGCVSSQLTMVKRKLAPFSAWLKKKRELTGVSQEALADWLGQEKAAISKWENKTDDTAIPPLGTLALMCEKLETTILEPLVELGYVSLEGSAGNFQSKWLLKQLDKLPPEAQVMVADIVKVFVNRFPKEYAIIDVNTDTPKSGRDTGS